MKAAATRQARGFTLIEVMVALAITAIALAAGMRATSALADNTGRQADVLLAQLCAENQLVALRLARQLPGIGDSRTGCTQAGRTLQISQSVRATPNPNFRRVDVTVAAQGQSAPAVRVTTIVGRN